ncbi:MAG: FAD-dependent oxidoreductase [Planctomycetota bacterium]|nr:MAG: FAD-dependent oxidoreductase [Planctomycetota bacterium]
MTPSQPAEQTSPQPAQAAPRIAIVGAGVSGLVAAGRLQAGAGKVSIFDKGRGVGGRISTRRTEQGSQFDHGAQYFTVRDARFRRVVKDMQADGVVAPWGGRIAKLERGTITPSSENHERFVGVPTMSAVGKWLARDLPIQLGTRIAVADRLAAAWRLTDTGGQPCGDFDWLLVAMPAPQAAELLGESAPAIADACRQVKMDGCWAAMIDFPEPLPLEFDGAFVHDSPLAWVARNSSKPGRPSQRESWVLHAGPEWSEAHLAEPAESVADAMLAEFYRVAEVATQQPSHLAAHRWRFAQAGKPLDEGCLLDAELRVAVCGDWCAGSRVEGAVLSGLAAAERCMAAR